MGRAASPPRGSNIVVIRFFSVKDGNMSQVMKIVLVGMVLLALSASTSNAIPPGTNIIRPSSIQAPIAQATATTDSSIRAIGDGGSNINAILVDDCTLQAFTGNDVCSSAANHPITVGSIGFPTMITISGDSASVTGPDSCNLNMWWESFTLDAPADVTVDFCCSGGAANMFNVLFNACPVNNNCNGFIFNDIAGSGAPVCSDSGAWQKFNGMAAGTYYIPLSTASPYQIHVTAVEPVGACCDLNNSTCVEGQTQSQCTALFASSKWSAGLTCSFADCNAPGPNGFTSSNVTMLSHLPLSSFPGNPTEANDVWSYVSPSGREYALIGLECSVGVVEVTDPVNPVIVGTASGPCSTWRDMKIHGEYAYNVIEQTGDGLQVIDLTQVDSGMVSLASTSVLDGFLSTSHNIAYNPDSGFLYLGLTNRNGGAGITAIDASDPINPVIAGEWIPNSGDRCHDIHVVTYDSGIYAGQEIAFCFAEGVGFYIVDVTDKLNMFQMTKRAYPNVTYCHQGWTTEDRKLLFFGDELDELQDPDVLNTTTTVFNIENLNAPILVNQFTNGKSSIDHNLIVRGDRIYEANYSTGLRVMDIADPLNPFETGFFDTFPADNRQDFVGLWGVDPGLPSGIILGSDIEGGLFVLRDDTAGPVARYKPSIGAPVVGQSVMFDGSMSMHPTPPRTIVSYEWDFSYDGLSFNVENTGMVIPHTFASAGTFSVALRVTDDDGVAKTNLISKDMVVELGLFAPVDLPGESAFTKDRYVSFNPSTNTELVAYRVTRVGDVTPWYVSCALSDLGAEGMFSTLVQTPEFCNWSTIPGVHVNGCIIVPGNEYVIQATGDNITLGDPLSIFTTTPQFDAGRQFGDITGSFIAGFWTAPDGLVTGNDIVATVQKFNLAPNALLLARADIDGAVPNTVISAGDILRAVQAFNAEPFSFGVTGCLTGTCVPVCP